MENSSYKSGFVALIGRTNVGKSTLMNRLIGQKIAITCNKPQTTRTRIRTILTEDRGQAIFIDTPGIHKAHNKLGEFMVGVAERTLNEVDLILWIVEPASYIGPGDAHIAELLKNNPTPKVLVVNKIDTVPKERLNEVVDTFMNICKWDSFIGVSATKGQNLDKLKDAIFEMLPEGPMYYDEDEITDQPERQIVAELIRESALDCLNDEIPHGIAVGIETMKERSSGGFFDIEATIVCEKDSHKGIIIGKGGQMLKKIGTKARLQIEALLGYRINLQLFVKVKKDWRDSDFLLKNYGFRDEPDE